MKRRAVLSFFAASLTSAGCGNSVAVKTIGNLVETSFGNASAFEPDYPDKLPYASVAVRQKGLKRSLLVLGRVSGDDFYWVSADRGILVTRHGRLLRTVGFAENINKTDFVNSDYFNGQNLPAERSTSVNRIIDLLPGSRYGIKIESSLQAVGQETIEIGKHRYDTTRFDEACVAQILGWKYVNSFWVDSKGKVWRSTQHFTPSADALTIEVTKPYQAS